MSKRGDNIHKRKDGRWEGRYSKGRNHNGSIKYGSVYAKSYREVKDKLTVILAVPPQNLILRNRERNFGEVANLWMQNNRIRLKGASINKYQNLIDTHIMPELGGEKLSVFTTTMINSFLTQKLQEGRLDKKGGLSASYVRSIMHVISSILKFAVQEQMCLPLKSPICKPAVSKNDITILSLEEQKQLEKHLLSELNPAKAGILISLHTGLRIGEICALSWEDIDLENHIIRVRHTIARVQNTNANSPNATCLIIDSPKTKASIRDIPISSVLLPILVELITMTSKFVVSETNGFISPRTYEYRYHRLLDESGINSINYHALRHTFATRCIEAGVDIKSLSEILGHNNVGVTLNTYVHSSMEMKKTQLEKLIALSE